MFYDRSPFLWGSLFWFKLPSPRFVVFKSCDLHFGFLDSLPPTEQFVNVLKFFSYSSHNPSKTQDV